MVGNEQGHRRFCMVVINFKTRKGFSNFPQMATVARLVYSGGRLLNQERGKKRHMALSSAAANNGLDAA